MTPETKARYSMSRWHLQIAWIKIKSAARALFGTHPWRGKSSAMKGVQ